jgi:hypothetical protein
MKRSLQHDRGAGTSATEREPGMVRQWRRNGVASGRGPGSAVRGQDIWRRRVGSGGGGWEVCVAVVEERSAGWGVGDDYAKRGTGRQGGHGRPQWGGTDSAREN